MHDTLLKSHTIVSFEHFFFIDNNLVGGQKGQPIPKPIQAHLGLGWPKTDPHGPHYLGEY